MHVSPSCFEPVALAAGVASGCLIQLELVAASMSLWLLACAFSEFFFASLASHLVEISSMVFLRAYFSVSFRISFWRNFASLLSDRASRGAEVGFSYSVLVSLKSAQSSAAGLWLLLRVAVFSLMGRLGRSVTSLLLTICVVPSLWSSSALQLFAACESQVSERQQAAGQPQQRNGSLQTAPQMVLRYWELGHQQPQRRAD